MARYANKQNLRTLVEALRDEYQTPSWVKGAEELGSGLEVSDGTLSVNATASSDGPADGPISELSAEGHAEQFSTTGKNLLDAFGAYNKATTTYAGCTITNNGDSYTLSGQNTSSAWSFHAVAANPIMLQPGTYILSYDGEIHGADLKVTIDDVMYSAGYPITLASEKTLAEWLVYVSEGNTISGTFRPQLEAGSTATEYEPYTGGAPSPSPDYPQEIEVVRGHEVTGKTGRFVSLEVRDSQDQLVSTTPIPLPSRGWVGSLPDGTADKLSIDGAGKVEWEKKTEETTTAATDGVTGTVGTDVLSTTGQIADGATVLYKQAPVTESLGYVDLPDIPEGSTVTIPELDALGISYYVDNGAIRKLAEQYKARLEATSFADIEDAVTELAAEVQKNTNRTQLYLGYDTVNGKQMISVFKRNV